MATLSTVLSSTTITVAINTMTSVSHWRRPIGPSSLRERSVVVIGGAAPSSALAEIVRKAKGKVA